MRGSGYFARTLPDTTESKITEPPLGVFCNRLILSEVLHLGYNLSIIPQDAAPRGRASPEAVQMLVNLS
jgi:hypothetical protein